MSAVERFDEAAQASIEDTAAANSDALSTFASADGKVIPTAISDLSTRLDAPLEQVAHAATVAIEEVSVSRASALVTLFSEAQSLLLHTTEGEAFIQEMAKVQRHGMESAEMSALETLAGSAANDLGACGVLEDRRLDALRGAVERCKGMRRNAGYPNSGLFANRLVTTVADATAETLATKSGECIELESLPEWANVAEVREALVELAAVGQFLWVAVKFSMSIAPLALLPAGEVTDASITEHFAVGDQCKDCFCDKLHNIFGPKHKELSRQSLTTIVNVKAAQMKDMTDKLNPQVASGPTACRTRPPSLR